ADTRCRPLLYPRIRRCGSVGDQSCYLFDDALASRQESVSPVSVCHGIHDGVDSYADRGRAVFERSIPLIQVLPEVAYIIVVISDQLEAALLVRHAPELRLELPIRRFHFKRPDVVEGVKDGMADIESLELALGNRLVEVAAKDVDFVRASQKSAFAKIIRHDEAASPDVLSKIGNLLV